MRRSLTPLSPSPTAAGEGETAPRPSQWAGYPPGGGWGEGVWAPIAASIGFLTVIPVPHVAPSPVMVGRGVALFPLVGATIGALLGGLGMVLERWLPAGPIAVLLIAAAAVITGGLHLDGLMDTADGLGGGTAEQRLAIMRDSQVGAFGVIAAGLAILGQFACLVELTGMVRLVALTAVYATSRWSMTLLLAIFPPARPDGLGAAFHAVCGRAPLVAGTLIAAVVALVTSPLGLIVFAGSAVAAFVGGRLLTRLLGGLTGDTYGAVAVLVETLGLFLAVAVLTTGNGS